MDELCISKRQNVWLWTAVSRQTSQILAYVIGDRTYDHVLTLRSALPAAYKRRRFYTDGYKAYAERLPASLHHVCQRYDGGTCTVEGVNNSLRHRCSFLVRKHSGPRHLLDSLMLRLDRAPLGSGSSLPQQSLSKTLGKATEKNNAVNYIT
jgi:IS1 family transposase